MEIPELISMIETKLTQEKEKIAALERILSEKRLIVSQQVRLLEEIVREYYPFMKDIYINKDHV